MQKRVPGGGPMPRTLYDLLNALFLRCQKSHSWVILHILVLNKRVRKTFQKKCKIFGTGSRRGATPGRLGAQNRWLLKGFLPEGRLHRTCGRDHQQLQFSSIISYITTTAVFASLRAHVFRVWAGCLLSHFCSPTWAGKRWVTCCVSASKSGGLKGYVYIFIFMSIYDKLSIIFFITIIRITKV